MTLSSLFSTSAARALLLSAGLMVGTGAEVFAMPLAQAVRIGTEQDADIRALQFDISRETTNIEVVKDGARPQLSAGAGTLNDDENSTAANVTIRQVLFDWGLVKSQVEAATEERAKVVAKLKMEIEQLTLHISQLYIDLEMIDLKLERTRDYLALANRIAEQSRARVDAGLANNAEIARARLEIARADERLTQLTSEREITHTQLEFLVGRAIPQPNRAPDLKFAERFSGSAQVIQAVMLAPASVSGRADLDIARAGIGSARASNKPKIVLQAEGRQAMNGGRNRSGSIGIVAEMDLTASNVRGRGVLRAEQAVKAAEQRLRGIERDLQNNIRVQTQNLYLLRANEASQLEQSRQAEEVLAAYEDEFTGGRRELIDLLTTARDLYDAQISVIDTYSERKHTEYAAAESVGMLGTLIIEQRR